jgi:signal transduction histidine kinase
METQMDYELSRKQDEIQKIEKQVNELALEKQLKELELNRQKNIQYFLVIIIVLVIVAVVLFYNRYRLKKKTNALLEERYNQLRQANLKLSQSEQKLRKANATKDKFFSIIAHDLRNPFNALYGLTDHISKNFKSHTREELQEFIQLIHESAEQLLNLLENLLYWSRSQRGKIPFNPKELNLKQVVTNTLELLQINAEEKKLSVITDLRHQGKVYADQEMVTTILRNLLSNAIKFSWEGGQVVVRSRDQEGALRLEVEDNGKGISPHNQEKLFRVDESFSSAGTQQEKGTGLGLILCKEFVEKHGGEIWVESEENQGSCFIFTLPQNQYKNADHDQTTD